MFLDLHHEVMNIDKVPSHTESPERSLGQHLLEPVVVLDQLRQGTLGSKDREEVENTKVKGHDTKRSKYMERGLSRVM